MPTYLARAALLPEGWSEGVRLSVDEEGWIVGVEGGRAASEPSGTGSATDRGAPGPTPAASPSDDPPIPLPGVVVPGIPNLHSHAFQRAMAGLAESAGPDSPARDTFWSWRSRMYDFLDRLGPEEVEAIAARLYLEMLRAGYTSVAEFHYLHHDQDGTPYADRAEMAHRIVAAARATGIGLTLLPTLYRTSDFGGAPPAPGQRRFVMGVDDFLTLHGALARDLSAMEEASSVGHRLGVALHSLRAVPPDDLDRVVQVMRAAAGAAPHPGGGSALPIHIHVAEQRREVEACLAWSGQRPVAWLLEHAPVDEQWCLIHATHMNAEEIQALAASGAVAGLCPTTEANLGDGLFPLRAFLEAGGALGIGSDSHASVDPIEELRWLEYGQRLTREERNVAAGLPHPSTARNLLDRVWEGGARACGRPIGRIAEGARADWLVLDPDDPLLAHRSADTLLDAWIFSGNRSPIREVWVGGRRVIESGHHPLEDEITARYREVAKGLTGHT